VIADEAAASRLSLSEFYRDAVRHQPEWREYLDTLD
jgi:hypothetical protein